MTDRVLTLNVGSSSFKWSLFDATDEAIDSGEGKVDLGALAARIGEVDVVAHRVVHGGERFREPVVVDEAVRRELEALVDLAPLHMPPALAVIDTARAQWPNAVQVAAFDTAFHATLGPEAFTYAVPSAWRVRRYGFHGLSVAYASSRIEPVTGKRSTRALVLHLGSGASITAVRDGRSVDTTMGMTPVEGLVMGTRPGSVDPGALVRLLRGGLSVDELGEGLEHGGGLRALAGTSDMRELARRASEGDGRARFARAQFIRSAAKHAGSLLAVLGGLDAVVFTGGIGENDVAVRAGVVAALGFAGIALDADANARSSTADRVVSASSSGAAVLVVHAREDVSLLRAARLATCSSRGDKELEHASSETNPGRDRLQ